GQAPQLAPPPSGSAGVSEVLTGGLEALKALGGDPREQVGGREAGAHGDAPERCRGRSDTAGLFVAVEHLACDAGPGEALGALARGKRHAPPPPRVEREAA